VGCSRAMKKMKYSKDTNTVLVFAAKRISDAAELLTKPSLMARGKEPEIIKVLDRLMDAIDLADKEIYRMRFNEPSTNKS